MWAYIRMKSDKSFIVVSQVWYMDMRSMGWAGLEKLIILHVSLYHAIAGSLPTLAVSGAVCKTTRQGRGIDLRGSGGWRGRRRWTQQRVTPNPHPTSVQLAVVHHQLRRWNCRSRKHREILVIISPKSNETNNINSLHHRQREHDILDVEVVKIFGKLKLLYKFEYF